MGFAKLAHIVSVGLASAAANSGIALLAAVPASAADPNFTYVQNSLYQSTIISGPWTLHESTSSFAHDASGIVPALAKPPQSSPPYVNAGVPYAGYCTASGQVTKNHGPSLMQPYYFPFVRRRGPQIEGFFDYRPRNEQEAVVSAFSNDWGATWHFTARRWRSTRTARGTRPTRITSISTWAVQKSITARPPATTVLGTRCR